MTPHLLFPFTVLVQIWFPKESCNAFTF
uniref:Uncharacterized protein n=1 Tax=Anguilla anguilla TaxID=7936 RepID=A0A0E9UNV7_ANGAN